MRLRFSALCFILVFFPVFSLALASTANEAVTVRIAKGLKQLQLVGSINSIQGKQVNLQGKIQINWRFGAWHVGQYGKSLYRITDKKLFLRGLNFKLNRKQIPSSLAIVATARGMHVLARLSLEDYLTGVVASEMPTGWPKEALKAQAVAARSYFLAAKKIGQYKQFDVESSIMDQVYNYENSKNKRVRRAVVQTANQVLKVKRSVLKAHFHSNCGGQTISPKLVWGIGRNAGTIGRCPAKSHFHWKKTISAADLRNKISKTGRNVGQILSLRATKRDRKRVIEVEVLTTGKRLVFSGHEFRKLIGFSQLKSTLFKIDRSEKQWLIRGQGYGHGVGLCQWGTKSLAERGMGYRRILSYYYPKARVADYIREVAVVSKD